MTCGSFNISSTWKSLRRSVSSSLFPENCRHLLERVTSTPGDPMMGSLGTCCQYPGIYMNPTLPLIGICCGSGLFIRFVQVLSHLIPFPDATASSLSAKFTSKWLLPLSASFAEAVVERAGPLSIGNTRSSIPATIFATLVHLSQSREMC